MSKKRWAQRIARRSMACAVGLLAASAGWLPAAAQESEGGLAGTIAGWFESSGDAEQGANENATPSHVFQAVQDLIAETEILREELGVFDYPPEAELQQERAPVHVYAKTLELVSKVRGIQSRLGVPEAEVGQIPFKNITPADVLANVQLLLAELRKVKSQMVIEREIQPAALVGGKTPSLVYQSLANASFLLDGLRGRPLTPDDVYLNCARVLDELELIAAKLRVPIELELPPIDEAKKPKDAALQALRAAYKVVGLQTRLGMEASGVPNLTLVRVTPSEVYDASNMLLADIARIKLHLDVNVPRNERSEVRGKAMDDAFAMLLLIIRNLDNLIAAASES